MEQGSEFFGVLSETLAAAVPRFAAALLIVLAGWALARLLQHLAGRGIGLLDRVYRRYSRTDGEGAERVRPAVVKSISRLVFWLILIAALALAASVLGIAVMATWVEALVGYLPTLAAGIAIVLVGFVFAALARELASHAAGAAGFQDNEMLGRVTQILIIACAVLVGASQMGIDVSLLVNLATVFIGALLGAFALSFGLATPPHVSNVISARYLQRHYGPGDRIRIGEDTGRILEITSRSVVLETAEGELEIPARRFAEEPVLKLASDPSDGKQ